MPLRAARWRLLAFHFVNLDDAPQPGRRDCQLLFELRNGAKPMRILELAEFYSEQGGGVRTYIAEKLAAAKSAGHQLTIVAPGAEDRVVPSPGGKIIWVKSPPIPIDRRYHVFWNQKPIDEIVAAERPHFIEGSSPWRGAWIAGRQSASIPKALIFHQDPVLTYPRTILRRILNEEHIDQVFAWFFRYLRRLQSLFDTSIVASSWMSDRLASLGLIRPQIVPFGVNRGEFSFADRVESTRASMLAECGVAAPDAKLLVTISRHHPEKRVPLMIEAAGMVARQRPLGLVIVGDGPARARIERLAARTPGVHVAGFVGDRRTLFNMLASTDAYLHGCPAETFGMVIAEALCAGLPLVVPNAGGAAEMASPGCAEFYAPDDAEGCARAITRLFARDQQRLRQEALLAAERISSTTDHFRALFSMYESIVEMRSKGRSMHEQVAVSGGLARGQQFA